MAKQTELRLMLDVLMRATDYRSGTVPIAVAVPVKITVNK